MQRLETLLRGAPELRDLSGRAGELSQLQKIWDCAVPETLRPFTRAGGFKHRRIMVFADNGAVAAKLKMQSASLLKNLQNKGLEVTSIRVEVQVQSRRQAPPAIQRHLSQQASSSLENLAGSLPESALRTALQRLAGRGE